MRFKPSKNGWMKRNRIRRGAARSIREIMHVLSPEPPTVSAAAVERYANSMDAIAELKDHKHRLQVGLKIALRDGCEATVNHFSRHLSRLETSRGKADFLARAAAAQKGMEVNKHA